PVGRDRVGAVERGGGPKRICRFRESLVERQGERGKTIDVSASRIEPAGRAEFSQGVVDAMAIEIHGAEGDVTFSGFAGSRERRLVPADRLVPLHADAIECVDGGREPASLVAEGAGEYFRQLTD